MSDSSNGFANVAGAVVPIAGQVFNALSQAHNNKKNREFSQDMYNQQKADSLDFWNTQNTYNSPQAQMARLQEAGLNPNLVYGNGSAVNTAGNIDIPHAQPYRAAAPQIDAGAAVNGYFNTQMKQATVSNAKKQGDLLEAQKRMMDANVINQLFQNQYNQDTVHIRREGDAAKANLIGQHYASELQSFNLNQRLMDTKVDVANATLEAIKRDNVLRGQKSDFLGLQNSINEIRKRTMSNEYDSSMGGMKLQDWLKLLLGAYGHSRR